MVKAYVGTTLTKHIIESQKEHPEATGALTGILHEIATAAKIISKQVNKAGLVDILGVTGEMNVQKEEVKKLDVFADEVFTKIMEVPGYLCCMASEENEKIINISKKYKLGDYVLAFDPLDGSSNIDANVSIGTIFSIHHRKSQTGEEQDFFQKGRKQVAAGYVIYGSSTMLVYSTGHGVYGFTLDPSIGEFLLSHPDIKTPERAKIFSVNEGYYNLWNDGFRNYIKYIKEDDKKTGRPLSGRYIGSLVADFHRNILYGGIFLYPADKKTPNGKLRLLYEAAPLAFLIDQAGGKASTGKEDILDITPTGLHQRVPLIIGPKYDVELCEKFMKGKMK